MDPLALLVFAAALALNAGSPGPSVAALVSRVIARGWREVVPFVAAMWIGEVIWLTLAMAGLGALAERFQPVFLVLKWAGVAYLLFLAWRLWRAPASDEVASDGAESGPPAARGSVWGRFAAGLTLTLGNPKIMVFYLALLPTLIDLSRPSLGLWAAAAAVTAASLAMVDLAWIFAAHKARALLRRARARRMANRAGALAMGGAAAAIATR